MNVTLGLLILLLHDAGMSPLSFLFLVSSLGLVLLSRKASSFFRDPSKVVLPLGFALLPGEAFTLSCVPAKVLVLRLAACVDSMSWSSAGSQLLSILTLQRARVELQPGQYLSRVLQPSTIRHLPQAMYPQQDSIIGLFVVVWQMGQMGQRWFARVVSILVPENEIFQAE